MWKQVVFLRLHDKMQAPKYNSAFNLSQLESNPDRVAWLPLALMMRLLQLKWIYNTQYQIERSLEEQDPEPEEPAVSEGHWVTQQPPRKMAFVS